MTTTTAPQKKTCSCHVISSLDVGGQRPTTTHNIGLYSRHAHNPKRKPHHSTLHRLAPAISYLTITIGKAHARTHKASNNTTTQQNAQTQQIGKATTRNQAIICNSIIYGQQPCCLRGSRRQHAETRQCELRWQAMQMRLYICNTTGKHMQCNMGCSCLEQGSYAAKGQYEPHSRTVRLKQHIHSEL